MTGWEVNLKLVITSEETFSLTINLYSGDGELLKSVHHDHITTMTLIHPTLLHTPLRQGCHLVFRKAKSAEFGLF